MALESTHRLSSMVDQIVFFLLHAEHQKQTLSKNASLIMQRLMKISYIYLCFASFFFFFFLASEFHFPVNVRDFTILWYIVIKHQAILWSTMVKSRSFLPPATALLCVGDQSGDCSESSHTARPVWSLHLPFILCPPSPPSSDYCSLYHCIKARLNT